MGLRDKYYIRGITYKEAMGIVVEKHYLHRKAPCSFSFGLIDRYTEEIKGVITYGTPASSTLRKGICGEEEKDNVIELTRLYIDDDVPKNGESFLIGNTLKLIDKEVVVSFAEIQQGHLGIVYQATNWIYCGLSAKRKDWKVKGINTHSHTLADKYTSIELKEKFGDDFYSVDRPRKHRYIFFNCNKRRKRELVHKLKYKIEDYPKNKEEL